MSNHTHAAMCVYCGEAIIYDTREVTDVADAHTQIVEHDQQCPKNPLVARIEFLNQQNTEKQEQNDALAAHVQRLINTGNATDMCTFGETKEVLAWDKACNDTPPTSLARRDALKQAEGAEMLRDELLQATKAVFHPHVAGVCSVVTERLSQSAEGHQ